MTSQTPWGTSGGHRMGGRVEPRGWGRGPQGTRWGVRGRARRAALLGPGSGSVEGRQDSRLIDSGEAARLVACSRAPSPAAISVLSAVVAVEPHPQQGQHSATARSSRRCSETQVHGPLGLGSAEPAAHLCRASQGTREPPQASHHRAGSKSGRLTNYPVKSKSFSNPWDYEEPG